MLRGDPTRRARNGPTNLTEVGDSVAALSVDEDARQDLGMGQYLWIHFSGMNIHLPAILGSLGTRVLTHPHLTSEWKSLKMLWIAVGYCVADRLSWVILWSLQNSGAHSKDGKSRDEGWICFSIWESSGWHHSVAQLKLQLNIEETELFWTLFQIRFVAWCSLAGHSEIQWDWGCLTRTCMRNGMHKMTCFSLRRRSDCANNKLPKTIILQLWIRIEYTVDEYRWILTWIFFCPFM